jgi:hypothetical protein
MRAVVILGCALALLAGRAGQAAQLQGKALFTMHSAQVYDYGVPLGLLGIAKDWSVAADGSTGSIVRYSDSKLGFGPFVLERLNLAPADVFQSLTASFAPAHVGSLAGNCSAYQVPTGQSYRFEITWYGRNGRMNHFVVANDFTAPCPPEMLNLLYAVTSFEKVMVDPDLPVWDPPYPR